MSKIDELWNQQYLNICKNEWGEACAMKKRYPVIDMVQTGKNIKSIMQRQGLVVKDVQKFLGLSTPQSIYHWFEGRSLPTVDNLYALSELFQSSVDDLLIGNRKYEYKYQNDRCNRLVLYYKKINELKVG